MLFCFKIMVVLQTYFYYFLAYLFGSIPFSYIIPKILRGVDVTKMYDTNVGASNAYYSTRSFPIALVCFFLDFMKGFLPAYFFDPIAGVFGVIGHQYSIFMIALKFRFRKAVVGLGMSATFGLLTVVAPLMIVISIAIFIVIMLLMSPINPVKWYEIEVGNIETVFAMGIAALIYIMFFNPGEMVSKAVLLLVISTTIAYSRRIRFQMIQFLNLDEKKNKKKK